MVNEVKMGVRDAILGLFGQGWSRRRIARELGVNRRTVARYVALAKKESKCTTNPTPGTDRPVDAELEGRASAPPELPGPPSKCKPFRGTIIEKRDAGLTAQRIWQDLKTEHGFAGSYQSVKRFCRRLGRKTQLPFRRIEVEPGAEVQADFGKGALVKRPNGKRRRPHVLRVGLSFSRKAYSQGIWRQTTDDFLGTLENSFWYFGGVPRTIVIDNLKAAVTKADWFDPELNPKIEAFARHYGCVILPTKPYTPRHKGKIESGVNYVQDNGLKNHSFESLEEHNDHLLDWEANVADQRIHGTTRKQVGKLFEEVERAALLPLPAERFPFFLARKCRPSRRGARRSAAKAGALSTAMGTSRSTSRTTPYRLSISAGEYGFAGTRDSSACSTIAWKRSPSTRRRSRAGSGQTMPTSPRRRSPASSAVPPDS